MERVNAELHELLEKYEAEFFQMQLALEADKTGALGQVKGLQDELMRLQERIAQMLANKDVSDLDQMRKSLMNGFRSGCSGVGGQGDTRAGLGGRGGGRGMQGLGWGESGRGCTGALGSS